MRRKVAALLGLALLLVGCRGAGVRVIAAHGVRVTVPGGWQEVRPAIAGPVTDPRTLLVVGTSGVQAKASRCQVAAYRVPGEAAVVVVVGWTSIAAAGGTATPPGRGPLKELVAVRRPSFECFSGRGAVRSIPDRSAAGPARRASSAPCGVAAGWQGRSLHFSQDEGKDDDQHWQDSNLGDSAGDTP